MGKKFRQLQYTDRLKIEALVKSKHTVIDMARRIGCCRQTIYNELQRGAYEYRRASDWKDIKSYSADLAQKKYEEGLAVRGTQLKIGSNLKLVRFIERQIIERRYSPEAVATEIKKRKSEYGITLCFKTIYNYIDKNIFLRLTNKDLPVRRDKKRKYTRIRIRKHSFGKNIDERPADIATRQEFGHWEMDTVVGPRGKSKHSLLVLTERKTRKEIIRLLKEHTAAEVVSRIDELETMLGTETFKKIFKTITVDNGSEFAYHSEMERSVSDGNRTTIYYCHPYSSWERGSNECANKLIRRHIPKSTNFDHRTTSDIEEIEKWINAYPRKMFGYRCANDLWEEELARLFPK